MNSKEFVDSLFTGYEETAALADFKEELLANLNAKIESFVKKGMDAKEAFSKATAELDDVSALADEFSLKKRNEVFEEMYLDIRHYLRPKRVVGYVVFGIVALFGLTTAALSYFGSNYAQENFGILDNVSVDMAAFFTVMMPFLTAAVIGFTFLGVTQETASLNPVSKKRGVLYALASGLISFGIFLMPVVYFGTKIANEFVSEIFNKGLPIVPVLAMVIPFILPGTGLLVYLVLTEKDRVKPWAKKLGTGIIENEMKMHQDLATEERFGMFSGAIWIFAIGLFILLGFIFGFKYSWPVFIFAVALQLLVQGLMYKKKGVTP